MMAVAQTNGHQKRRRVEIVSQFKYDLDAHSPLWKRLFFRFIYAPFVEFCMEKLKLVPWDRRESDGSYSWREIQGVFNEPWQAAREAEKYAHGWSTSFVVDEALEAKSTLVPQLHPNAATRAYERINERMVEIPRDQFEGLKRKLKETEHLV